MQLPVEHPCSAGQAGLSALRRTTRHPDVAPKRLPHFEAVDVDEATWFTPARLDRFTGPVKGRRAESGGAYTLRVEAFGSKFEIRITRTPLDGGASTLTFTGSTSGTTEQWVEVDVPLPDDGIYWLTLELQSATLDGIVRQVVPSEPEIDTGDFP